MADDAMGDGAGKSVAQTAMEQKIARRVRAEARLEAVEKLTSGLRADIVQLARDVDAKDEKLAHNMVDKFTDRLEAQLETFAADQKNERLEFERRIERLLTEALKSVPKSDDLPGLVQSEYARIHAEERDGKRRDWKHYSLLLGVFVTLGGLALGILSFFGVITIN